MGETQYGNKFLIAYENVENSNSERKIVISLVENAKETILKEIEGYEGIRR